MADQPWPFAPWVRVDRGGRAEAMLQGALIVVDDTGRERARWGDPSWPSYLRSSSKMIQALPLVRSGAAQRFELEPRHLAVCCASHSGEPIHVATVREILARCRVSEDVLHCGPHPPYHEESAAELVRQNQTPLPIHSDCSGKHAGMMATCVHRGWDVPTYWKPTHPLQREIHDTIARLAGVDTIPTATDGCGVPTFYLGLDRFALAVARFMAERESDSIVHAMMQHPEMVGGTGRFCTALPRAANRPILAKAGAEGLYVVAWREDDGRGVALCAKAAAGDARSRDFAITEAAAQLGLLDKSGLEEMAPFHRGPVLNWAGEEVGERVALFRLSAE